MINVPKSTTRIEKHPATYRLPADALSLIEAAVEREKKLGNRLTREDAVRNAIRAHYNSDGSTR
jgi:hypothetical protein